MSKATQSLKDFLSKLSQGDLTARLDPSLLSKKGDIGQIAQLAQRIGQNMKDDYDALEKISHGNLANIQKDNSHGALSHQISDVAESISAMSCEIAALTDGVSKGNTGLRADLTNYSGCYKKVLQDVNTSLDEFNAPILEVNAALLGLSVNDFSYRITKEYHGSFKKLTDNMNSVCDRLAGLIDSIIRISVGDTSDLENYKKVGARSEQDKIAPAMLAITQSIENMAAETERLSKDAGNGKIIGNRIDTSGFNGRFKSIAEDMNNILLSISAPLSDLSQVLDAVAVKDFTLNMSCDYTGDFESISVSMSKVILCLRHIQKLASEISHGDISGIEELKKAGKGSENDHLTTAFIRMMESIQKLIGQSEALSNAASEGNFDYQCDMNQFEGEFKVIISNFEKMFGNITAYIREESAVMNAMSNGSLHVSMKDGYKGQLGKLSDDINLTAKRLGDVTTEITEALIQISNGNLAIDEVRHFRGDYSTISDATNKIVADLNEILSSISIASEQVASGSSQVSLGSQNLSQGATEQASSVEELTSSITEIAAQTKANAEDANKAAALEATVKEDAREGMSHMNEMLKSMEDLKASSNKISKIIKTIDDIAFQTNILALNAAVEAARAGQAGKGFAVVADEVRNLAAKSAKASSETTALIEETISKVNDGSEITGKTAKALNNIVEGIGKVESLIGKIATASNDQATGLSQIDTGITQVSQVVQTNSATAEESAAASEELTSQADLLKSKVSSIKLKNVSHYAAAPHSESQNDMQKTQSVSQSVKINLDKDEFGKY